MNARDRFARIATIAGIALTLAVAGACRQNARVVESTAETAPAAQPAADQGQLPEGHPPVGGEGGAMVPPAPPGTGAGETGLVWDVPESWVVETPSSAMRRAQYRVPGPGGDGQCVVFYFGPGQGGDAKSNAERWARQFAQPDGRDSVEVMKTRTFSVGDVQVTEVEVTGTYGGGMMMGSPSAGPKENWMLLGAIAAGPDANWFFKFTGPKTTVEANREAFGKLLRSLRKGGSKA
ncbi:MAG: hypothetical protein D6738_08825 [Acidobacteria bacterium]|nr:MAG: hypothetical protein D6738_08825 [Acidobacteriota bacterium]